MIQIRTFLLFFENLWNYLSFMVLHFYFKNESFPNAEIEKYILRIFAQSDLFLSWK